MHEVIDIAPYRRPKSSLLDTDLANNVYARPGRPRGARYRCAYCRAAWFVIAMYIVAGGLWSIDVLISYGVYGVLPEWMMRLLP